MKETKKVGRKLKYGEETVLMRIPRSMVPDVEAMLKKREVFTDKWFDSQLPPAAEKLIDRLSAIFVAPGRAIREMVVEDMYSAAGNGHKKSQQLIVAAAQMETDEDYLQEKDIENIRPVIRELLVDVLQEV